GVPGLQPHLLRLGVLPRALILERLAGVERHRVDAGRADEHRESLAGPEMRADDCGHARVRDVAEARAGAVDASGVRRCLRLGGAVLRYVLGQQLHLLPILTMSRSEEHTSELQSQSN